MSGLAKTIADPWAMIGLPVIIAFQVFALVSIWSDGDWVMYKVGFGMAVAADAVLGIREAIARNLKVWDGIGGVVAGSVVVAIWVGNHGLGLVAVFMIQAVGMILVLGMAVKWKVVAGVKDVPRMVYAIVVYAIGAAVCSILDLERKQRILVNLFQPVMYAIYLFFDLYLYRVPWSRFVMSFAEGRDVKYEISVIFLKRTMIPLSWNFGFCVFFVIREFQSDAPQMLKLLILMFELACFTITLYCVVIFFKAYWRSDSSKKGNIYTYLNEDKAISISRSSIIGQSFRRSQYGSLDVI